MVNASHRSDAKASAPNRLEVTDNLDQLLDIFPHKVRYHLDNHPHQSDLIEVVMDLGRIPEARFSDSHCDLGMDVVTREDLQYITQRVGDFGGDNRAGIERTLHRISAMRNRRGEVVGLTCRIGRAIYGTIVMIRDLIEQGQSILLLGRPGVGKTTALREIARVLADDLNKRVVIIDTSNEIAGDGDIVHPAIGRARRMQVASPELQHQVMIEAVENHMPEVIVIDEIGTELEALAARTIAERGVQLVGTAHGNRIENLIKNPTLSDLVGGIQAVTLGDEEARRRGSQKTVLERKAPPTFAIGVEMLERQTWVIHESLADTVDQLLRNREPSPQTRSVNGAGEIIITESEPGLNPKPSRFNPFPEAQGLRASGKMVPLPFNNSTTKTKRTSRDRDRLLSHVEHLEYQELQEEESQKDYGHEGHDLPMHVYAYGLSRSHLEHVINILELPIVLTKDMGGADAVIALRSQLRNHAKLRQAAKAQSLPIHVIKSNNLPQVTRGLRRILNLEEPSIPTDKDMALFTHKSSDDEIEALEEARLAVEQIVIPTGQPVELLPRSPKVRKMQHELVEHYHLSSDSFGSEPNRRLRIYPA